MRTAPRHRFPWHRSQRLGHHSQARDLGGDLDGRSPQPGPARLAWSQSMSGHSNEVIGVCNRPHRCSPEEVGQFMLVVGRLSDHQHTDRCRVLLNRCDSTRDLHQILRCGPTHDEREVRPRGQLDRRLRRRQTLPRVEQPEPVISGKAVRPPALPYPTTPNRPVHRIPVQVPTTGRGRLHVRAHRQPLRCRRDATTRSVRRHSRLDADAVLGSEDTAINISFEHDTLASELLRPRCRQQEAPRGNPR